MRRLQIIDAKEMEKLLYHKGRVLARPLIREILREIEISVDDYNLYLKKIQI